MFGTPPLSVSLRNVNSRKTYISINNFSLKIAPADFTIFYAAFALTGVVLEVFPAYHAVINIIRRFFVTKTVVKLSVYRPLSPVES
jgi:hypothetical protein